MLGMMTVQNNLLAMGAARSLGVTTNDKAKSTRKLSSGFKINSAADDAAGLSISEKMRNAIRGLHQGSDNIQDGISMTQTAEGALSEVTDMLQRMAELSIKAYNETNTESDQQDIQAEISQLVNEIKRTADTTTFNEIPLLKGNPWVNETIMVEPSTQIIETSQTIVTGVPDWLYVDEKLEQHSYAGTQDTSQQAYFLQYETDTNGVYKQPLNAIRNDYYGPRDDALALSHGITGPHAGVWSDAISDNPTARVSFEQLATTEDAGELYGNLAQLLGTSIGMSCGTCRSDGKYYGIAFSGEIPGYKAMPLSYFNGTTGGYKLSGTTVDLPAVEVDWDGGGTKVGLFDAVTNLMQKFDAEGTSEADKKTQTKALAERIAGALRDHCVEAMSSNVEMNSHYDRVLSSGSYDFIVYDFRDQNSLTNMQAANTDVLVSTNAIATTIEKKDLSARYENELRQSPVRIVCSGSSGDAITINLPDVRTLWQDQLSEYNVARYTEVTTYSYEHFEEKEEEYQKRLEKWEEECEQIEAENNSKKAQYEADLAAYEEQLNKYNLEHEAWEASGVPTKQTVSIQRLVQDPPIVEWINGEMKMTTQTRTVSDPMEVIVMSYPNAEPTEPVKPSEPNYKTPPSKPVKGQGTNMIPHINREYTPDDVSIIDDALKKVLRWRSELGAEQNRLEHTLKNNRNKEENTTAAESRIRDTDVASEMVNFSMQNILEQSGVSMLAQANQSQQNVLSLLG